MAPRRLMPAPLRRCRAPIQSSRSGLTGFFTSTGTSTPFSASARDCMAKGLAVVRAPTHNTSMPYFSASSTCSGVATSVAVRRPVSCFTICIQGRAFSPLPSKPPGLVRGFQIPARKMWKPLPASCLAVFITWSSVSAEQGPAIMNGLSVLQGRSRGSKSNSILYVWWRLYVMFRLFRLSRLGRSIVWLQSSYCLASVVVLSEL